MQSWSLPYKDHRENIENIILQTVNLQKKISKKIGLIIVNTIKIRPFLFACSKVNYLAEVLHLQGIFLFMFLVIVTWKAL